MNQDNANRMVSLAEVEELLRREAEAFKAELQAVHEENVRITHKHEEVSHKYAEITHQLEMTRRDADATQRQRRAIEEGLPRLDSNIQRTESLKQNLQKLASTFDESKNDLEAALMVLQAKHANHSLELSRLYNHLTSAQGGASPTVMEIRSEHDRMRALIDEQEKMLGRTNARRDTVACDCTHKTINENMDKLRHRISNVEQWVRKALKKLPATAKSAERRKDGNNAGNTDDNNAAAGSSNIGGEG